MPERRGGAGDAGIADEDVEPAVAFMPEESRGASWLLPVNDSSLNSRPLRRERIETGIEVAPDVSSSTSVFHSPQDSHLPCQRLYAAPQFWQMKERVDLAIVFGVRFRKPSIAQNGGR